VIAFDIKHFDSVGSTSDEAMRLAAEGVPHGTVVHADEQTMGRGRFSRRWFSPPGNLYLSIILRLDIPAARSVEIGFVAALAVADAIDAMLPPQVRATVKWPNDVLVNDGKIAGILMEQADDALILGIGVNVLHEPDRVSYKVSTIVGCGGLAAVDDTRARLLTALAERLDVWQRDGFAPVRTAWLARAHPPGSPIRISVGDRAIVGRFTDLAHDGALVVETADGPVRVVAGDVALMPRPDAAPPAAFAWRRSDGRSGGTAD
jgi:BirA family transcriptional regulator, biotin operon repressor / biotin---[acetyl-CoA-carboxylase] ligase